MRLKIQMLPWTKSSLHTCIFITSHKFLNTLLLLFCFGFPQTLQKTPYLTQRHQHISLVLFWADAKLREPKAESEIEQRLHPPDIYASDLEREESCPGVARINKIRGGTAGMSSFTWFIETFNGHAKIIALETITKSKVSNRQLP